MPYVSWTPNLNTNGDVRAYTVMDKTNLTDVARVCPTKAVHKFGQDAIGGALSERALPSVAPAQPPSEREGGDRNGEGLRMEDFCGSKKGWKKALTERDES